MDAPGLPVGSEFGKANRSGVCGDSRATVGGIVRAGLEDSLESGFVSFDKTLDVVQQVVGIHDGGKHVDVGGVQFNSLFDHGGVADWLGGNVHVFRLSNALCDSQEGVNSVLESTKILVTSVVNRDDGRDDPAAGQHKS